MRGQARRPIGHVNRFIGDSSGMSALFARLREQGRRGGCSRG
jgi:hypothetical protein